MSKRVLLGKFPDGDNSPNGYGLRVSKSGYDVSTVSPDNANLIFNSDWAGILPLHTSGLETVSAGTTKTIQHGLGYIPFVSALVNVSSRGWEQYACVNLTQRCIQLKTRDYYKRTTDSFGNITYPKNTLTDYLSDNPERVYSYNDTSGKVDTVRIKAYSDRIELYASVTTSFYYMIYRQKAF